MKLKPIQAVHLSQVVRTLPTTDGRCAAVHLSTPTSFLNPQSSCPIAFGPQEMGNDQRRRVAELLETYNRVVG